MDIKELLAKANAPASSRKVESQKAETNSFDELGTFISDINQSSPLQPNIDYGTNLPEQFEIGDPVVGMHKGQKLAGQVIDVNGDKVTVEWKDKEVTVVSANQLELSDVDTDYEEQTMYIESNEPYMGFDKESFNEDSDLEALLRGDANGNIGGGASFKYDANGDL